MLRILPVIAPFVLGATVSAQDAPSIQWQRALGGSGTDAPLDIQATTDGGYIVCGWTESTNGDVTGSHGLYDAWVVKLDGSGALQWQRALGGSGMDAAYAVQQTADGGYILAGYSDSNDGDVTLNQGNKDYWVVKLDATGATTWQRTFGGSDNDIAYAIRRTDNDGGYVLTGYSFSSDGDVTNAHGGNDVWVVKLDAAGTMQWQRSLGGSADESADDIRRTSDGGYICVGITTSDDGDVSGNHGSSDVWVVKLDASGAVQWQHALGGGLGEAGYAVWENSDGSFVVSAHAASNNGDVTGNHGGIDAWVVELDAAGALVWQKALGGSGWDVVLSILPTADGGYLVAGGTDSGNGDVVGQHGMQDAWIVHLDAAGELQWQQPFGGSAFENAQAMVPAPDGGHVFIAYASSTDGDVADGTQGGLDFWVVKMTDVNAGIGEVPPAPMMIAPNPAHDVVTVTCPGPIQAATITLQDVPGREIMRHALIGPTVQFDLAGLARGPYLITYRSGTRCWSERLIVQ